MSVGNRRGSAGVTAAIAAAALSLALACGGGSPSGSTPPVTRPPQPTPTAPIGSGSGVGATCALGPGDPDAECGKTTSKLIGTMLTAMDLLVQQKPQIFDMTSEAGPGTAQFRVLDKEAYLNGLLANLVSAGYCAQRDPDDPNYERIQVKNENGFSENFDVLAGSGYMRRSGSYFESCTPAAFPVDRGDLPPAGSGCGYPYPPPVAKMNCKLHLYGPEFYTLDSTALVGDAAYCALVGFTDGRSLCPVRPEGSPERVPCEAWRVGNAQDTGRPGPTWTTGGRYCTGPASGCENHPTNQYALLVYNTGAYKVCASEGACCTVDVQR